MIKSLRKKHLQVWTALAFLLPVGIIAATIAVPKYQHDKLLQPAATIALPIVLKTSGTEAYSVDLRTDEKNTAVQLEWTNKKTLIAPTALIYQVTKENDKPETGLLIGRIAERGIYRFGVTKQPEGASYHFVVYDILHHKNIYSITL